MRQEAAALRDFSPIYVRFGSFATESAGFTFRPMSASPRKQTWLATVREIWSSGLQQDRAISARGNRYDKLAANYLAFVQLASIRRWLRVNESTT